MVMMMNPANAFLYSGGDLLQDCESSDSERASFCHGYILGIDSSLHFVTEALRGISRERAKEPYCIPDIGP
jgi:hypothetical protein